MGCFLRFVLVFLLSICLSSADNIQNFIDKVVGLYGTGAVTATQFFQDVYLLWNKELTDQNRQYILKAQLPPQEVFPKMSKKALARCERRIYAKVLLLALCGQPEQALNLLDGLDYRLLYSTSPVLTKHPWAILLYCINVSWKNQYMLGLLAK